MMRCFALLILIALVASTASGSEYDINRCDRGDVRWFISWGLGRNHRIPNRTRVPHLEFNVAALEFQKFTSRRTSIGCELSASDQTNKGSNTAVSILMNYTRYFAVRGRFSADWKVGLGGMHMGDRVDGQATRNNFNEHLGVGIQYATDRDSAIRLDYTFYHASNAGIELPNLGINATVLKLGFVHCM